jgi:hypothetical protein
MKSIPFGMRFIPEWMAFLPSSPLRLRGWNFPAIAGHDKGDFIDCPGLTFFNIPLVLPGSKKEGKGLTGGAQYPEPVNCVTVCKGLFH